MRAERRHSDADAVINLLRGDGAVENLPADAKITELFELLPVVPDEEVARAMSHGSEDEERQILELFMRTKL